MERARFIHGQHFYMSVLAIDFTEGGGGNITNLPAGGIVVVRISSQSLPQSSHNDAVTPLSSTVEIHKYRHVCKTYAHGWERRRE